MSGDTLALVRGRVDVHPRGFFSLRGRSHAVEVFELLGAETALPQGTHRSAMPSGVVREEERRSS